MYLLRKLGGYNENGLLPFGTNTPLLGVPVPNGSFKSLYANHSMVLQICLESLA